MSNVQLQDPAFGESFENVMRRFFAPVRFGADVGNVEMRIDLEETEGAYNVTAELPGVQKDDISVRVDGNVVQIDAQVKKEKREEGEKGRMLRCERYYGSVSRSFSLPVDVQEDKARASYSNGVLRLELPKKTAATARKLQVQ